MSGTPDLLRPSRDLLCRSREITPPPASMAGKIDLVARRVRCGWDFFEAVASIPGAQAAIQQRLGVAHGTFSHWQEVGYLSHSRLKCVAAALGIPADFLPSKDRQLLKQVAELLCSGTDLPVALKRIGANAALARTLGIAQSGVRRWAVTGVPTTRIAQVSAVLGILPAQIRRSRSRSEGRIGYTMTPGHLELMQAGLRRPEVRAKLSRKAKKQPRSKGTFVKRVSWKVHG